MRKSSLFILGFFLFFLLALGGLTWASFQYDDWSKVRVSSFPVPDATYASFVGGQNWQMPVAGEVQALPEYLNTSLQWLADAQAGDGGWGAGLHSAQGIRDPRAVATDPATTAFAAMALLRAGTTLEGGPFRDNLQAAMDYLLQAVEQTNPNDQNITDATGTQPQRKLGENVDVAMAAQFFARMMPHISESPALLNRVTAALDQCVIMLEASQLANGSWNTHGWAPILNSAMGNTALELAQRVGRPVNPEVVQRSQQYQQQNVVADGSVRTESAAGIPLYALASTQRATASAANATRAALADEFEQTADTLSYDLAYEALSNQGVAEEEAAEMARAYVSNVSAARQVVRDDVQQGFGNNGGEEFLSHMLTSESLAAVGGTEWKEWHTRVTQLYGQIQNGNGSWSGHHCITSPVFCTAAVIMSITADREPKALMASL